MGKKVLVFAAHPDDEVLGCGATMAKHAAAGDEVHIVILAEGVTSRLPKKDKKKTNSDLTNLAKAAKKSAQILGAKSIELLDFPDNRMDGCEILSIIQTIESYLERYEPHTVYTHYYGDLNIDHQIVNRAVVTACRPLPKTSLVNLLFFEIPSSTEWQIAGLANQFSPNYFVGVDGFLEKKLRALECYKMEMRDWPHPRSIEAAKHIAKRNGSIIGVDTAEAFMLGRAIQY